MASPPPSSRERLLGPDSTKVGRSPASKENTVAADVLQALLRAEKGALDLKKTVQDIVGEYGWTENIAKVVLGGLEDALKKGVQGGQVMKEAFKKVISEARKFAHSHPYFCILIALGILALLMPWVLEALGFAKLGPVKGDRFHPG
jgi:hypothetical protein